MLQKGLDIIVYAQVGGDVFDILFQEIQVAVDLFDDAQIGGAYLAQDEFFGGFGRIEPQGKRNDKDDDIKEYQYLIFDA
jgi:hypothetical protein